MSKIIYSIMDEDLVFDNINTSNNSFLINNHHFFINHFTKKSKYFGFFWKPYVSQKFDNHYLNNNYPGLKDINKTVFRILDSINVVDKPKKLPDTIIINGKAVDVFDDYVNERFFIPSESNSLCYELNFLRRVRPFFDIKKIFDNREWGRIYNVEVLKQKIALVSFEKRSDEREDKLPNISEYKLYVAIAFDGIIRTLNEWQKVYYDYDKERNSPGFERYVFVPFEFYTKKLVFTVGIDKKKVIKEALKIMKHFDKKYIFETNNELNFRKTPETSIDFAYDLALNSLNSLVQNDYIEAGLPWFYEEWTRDEALSLSSLILTNNLDSVKTILLKLLAETKIKGFINAKYDDPHSKMSADALFFAAKSFERLISFSKQNNIDRYVFSKGFYKNVVNNLEQSVDIITKYYSEGSLIFSKPGNTWMDSEYDGDSREGYNIEINAMMLYVYNLLHKLTGKEVYSLFESKLKTVVRDKFWNGVYLVDNLKSKIVRPNVFLAYYFYPQLLSYHEWVRCFDYVLDKLWLDWGGLSSIDKNHYLFTPFSTGEDTKSYHRGDSWFFINNIAALDMINLDKAKYLDYITKIISASTKDILLKAALGHASEISDASVFNPKGSLVQAWSNATYVELISKLFYS